MNTILIIDDNLEFLEDVDSLLQDRFNLLRANTATKGLELLRLNNVSGVLLDLQLPDIYGFEVLEIIHNEIDPYLPVIIITEYDNTENVVKAMKKGAYDFLSKDFNLELLSAKIENAIKHRNLEIENKILQRNQFEERNKFIFADDSMKKINFEITRLAKLEFDVMIEGETGVGKDMVAYEIHSRSNRKKSPFISISLKSLSETLLESELFGHEKGAFTGAANLKIGLFEAANGGTIYFPEISCLNESMQMKLLHFMQYKTISRVGQDPRKGEIKLDLKLIFATNENLENLVENEKIREDFYYRITGVKLEVPPLRDRKEDIERLAEYFLNKYSIFFLNKKFSFSSELISAFKNYHWSGNVRELENSIKSALSYADSEVLQMKDFPNLTRKTNSKENTFLFFNSNFYNEFPPFENAEKDFKKAYYIELLQNSQNKISVASGISGLTPQGLRKALKSLDIDKNL